LGEKTVTLRHEGGMRFVSHTQSGHNVVTDNAAGNAGPRPTELVLAAVGACTGMDVAEILAKKRQAVEAYSIEVRGTQREASPNVFTDVTVLHTVEGNVQTAAVRAAIELSATKFCTVSAQLATGVARISHRYVIRRPASGRLPAEESGEVVATGPGLEVASA
jgi:putative redox protein